MKNIHIKCGPTISDHTKQHCRNNYSMITPEAWTPVIIKYQEPITWLGSWLLQSYISISFRVQTTLNETFKAKYDGVLPRTPLVRPKSVIYTPTRDDEHPHPFPMRILSPPPPPPPRVSQSFAWTWLWTALNQRWKPVLSWESLPRCHVTKKHENEGKNWRIGGEFTLFG